MIMDSISFLLALVLGGILLVCVNHFSYGWRGPSKSGARLPKGSFGFPLIGESLALARNPPTFASSHVKRYGTVFKSNLFLRPSIVGTTPEFAKFVLSNSHLFSNGWHSSLSRVVGPRAFIFKDGPPHMTVKKLILKAFRPGDILRTQVNVVESIILRNLASWEQQGTVVARLATGKLTADTSMRISIGAKDIQSTPEGRKALENFSLINRALFTVPLNLPGTAYRKGLKAKADLSSFLKTIVQRRKHSSENPQNDVLGALLSAPDDAEAGEERKELDDDDLVDNLVAILFAMIDTTSTTLTWVLKYLIEHPDVFRRVRAEQQEILKDKDPSDGGPRPRLTWEDTKKMVYTIRFFNEVQRILSISTFVTRIATQDIEYEGEYGPDYLLVQTCQPAIACVLAMLCKLTGIDITYQLIPKGWAATPMLKSIHFDPTIYPNPHTFNPDRFNVTPKSNTYLPFGSGVHMCPGMEIAKLVVLIFVHHITTTYTYESIGPDLGFEYSSFVVPVGGFPISIKRATKAD